MKLRFNQFMMLHQKITATTLFAVCLIGLIITSCSAFEFNSGIGEASTFYFPTGNVSVEATATLPFNLPPPADLQFLEEVQLVGNGSKYCQVQREEFVVEEELVLGFDGEEFGKDWETELADGRVKDGMFYGFFDNGSLVIRDYNATRTQPIANLLKANDNVNAPPPPIRQILYNCTNCQGIPWENLSPYLLVLSASQIFILVNNQIYHLVLEQSLQNNTNNFVLKSIIDANKRKVLAYLQYQGKMMALCADEVIIYEGSGNWKTAFQKPSGDGVFVQFDVDHGYIYVISNAGKIIAAPLNPNLPTISYEIQYADKATKIDVMDRTMFLTYHLRSSSYVAQLYIKDGSLVLNKFYYNYPRIQQLHILTTGLGIVDAYDEYILFRHSVNRNIYQSRMNQTELVNRNSTGRVVRMQPLGVTEDGRWRVAVIKRLEVRELALGKPLEVTVDDTLDKINKRKTENSKIRNKAVHCYFDDEGYYEINAKYTGLCSYKQSFTTMCSLTNTYGFTIETSEDKLRREHLKVRILLALLWIALITFVVLGLLGYRRHILNIEKEIQKKRERTQARKAKARELQQASDKK